METKIYCMMSLVQYCMGFNWDSMCKWIQGLLLYLLIIILSWPINSLLYTALLTWLVMDILVSVAHIIQNQCIQIKLSVYNVYNNNKDSPLSKI